MKELSIKEKAKRYDELKVTAQELEHDGCFDKITLFDLFPELKESEDERIRKELFKHLKEGADGYEPAGNSEDYKRWLGWLEKQGEQKPVDIRTTGYWNVQDVEQKPAWSEEDERMLQVAISGTFDRAHLSMSNWLKSLKDRVQLKQEWSEEDDIMVENIRNSFGLHCGQMTETLKEQYDKFFNKVKSLKDRVLPQQEWSEEEIEKAAQEWNSKANFNPFYMTMDGDKPIGVNQNITTHKESFKAGVNWILKSLRPQKQ